MNRDPQGEQAARLFAAGRMESPSEQSLRRIKSALQAQTAPKTALAWRGQRAFAFALAALSLSGLLLYVTRTNQTPVDISAESEVITQRAKAPREDEALRLQETAEEPPFEKPSALESPSSKPGRAPLPPEKRAPPTLDEELTATNAARTALRSGDATSALAELDRFEKTRGWRKLGVEASLLRIEALSKLGNAEEARARAARFIEENPNNPLVDRAAQFARPSPSEDAENPENTEERK